MDSFGCFAKLLVHMRINLKSLCIACGIFLLMTMMFFAGQWVGQTDNGMQAKAQDTLKDEEFSLLRKNEFLDVKEILDDPTTNYHLHIHYNQQPKYQLI